MEGFNSKITYASKELSAKEKVMLKDTSVAISLDELTAEAPAVIEYAYHVIVEIHNERSDNKDYKKIIVVDKDDNRYVTGSESFITALKDIVDDMSDAGESDNITLKVYRKESKNYKGKTFITCSLI